MKNDICGFTLIEVIAILFIIGILAAIAVSRFADMQSIRSMAAADTLKNRIRFVQSQAMKNSSWGDGVEGEKCWGITCDQNSTYWFFAKSDPEDADNQFTFPGEKDVKITVSDVTITPFKILFDIYGIPYTAFTDENTNAKLVNPLQITVGSETMTLIPETGFIQ
ncbi:pilus assembly FimT family protein [Desulfobacter vibrioformis]|uniref:pilus assembly FimT family protein n=1 Tax=Desulfobacter vibrioformis TaxID=34031 RepID=UPI0012EBBCCF|nr:type II secretion system protein [Desulfobacter vibrioformis]